MVLAVGLVGDHAMAQSTKNGSTKKPEGSTMKSVAFSSGVATLTPQNSKIEFIGTHVGDDPKPRLGGFKNFKGEVKLAADNSVEAINLEIDVKSLWTQFNKLTTHLNNADFFETNKYPYAKFVSSRVTAGEKGMQVTGNLTLHGTTKEISFPVKGKLDQSGVVMVSEFKLDRTMFGMDKMTSGVEKMVSLKFVVGQPTEVKASAPGPGTEKKKSGSGNKGSDAKQPELTLISLYAPNMT